MVLAASVLLFELVLVAVAEQAGVSLVQVAADNTLPPILHSTSDIEQRSRTQNSQVDETQSIGGASENEHWTSAIEVQSSKSVPVRAPSGGAPSNRRPASRGRAFTDVRYSNERTKKKCYEIIMCIEVCYLPMYDRQRITNRENKFSEKV